MEQKSVRQFEKSEKPLKRFKVIFRKLSNHGGKWTMVGEHVKRECQTVETELRMCQLSLTWYWRVESVSLQKGLPSSKGVWTR